MEHGGECLYTKYGDKLQVIQRTSFQVIVEFRGVLYSIKASDIGEKYFASDPMVEPESNEVTNSEILDYERAHYESIRPQINAFEGVEIGRNVDTGGFVKLIYGFPDRTKDEILAEPYFARMDISDEDKEIHTFYVGKNIGKGGIPDVIKDWRSPIGIQQRQKSAVDFTLKGNRYHRLLDRAITFDQGEIKHVEDEYVSAEYSKELRNGQRITSREKKLEKITDPFLVKLLRQKRKQGKLTDIIVSIQENQNQIIMRPMTQNIIVQGCAGSGKTMILLHRLSQLLYDHPALDASKISIMTPNPLFDLHIDDLSKSLGLGKIKRFSFENFVLDHILQYAIIENGALRKLTENPENGILRIQRNDFGLKEQSRFREKRLSYANPQQIDCGLSSDTYEMVKLFFDDYVENLYNKINIEKIQAICSAHDRTLGRKIGGAVEKSLVSMFSAINSAIESIQKTQDNEFVNSKKKEISKLQENLEKAKIDTASLKLAPEKLKEIREEFQKSSQTVWEQIQELKEFEAFLTEQRDKTVDELKSGNLPSFKLQYFRQELDSLEGQILEVEGKIYVATELRWGKILSDTEAQLEAYLAEQTITTEDWRYLNDVLRIINNERIVKVAESMISDIYTDKQLSEREYLCICLFVYMLASDDLEYPTDFLCIDEGQDLTLIEYDLLCRLGGGKTVMNIYGDIRQQVRSTGIKKWSELEPLFNYEWYELRENYRNTEEINNYCNAVLGHGFLSIGDRGEPVYLIDTIDFIRTISELIVGRGRYAIIAKDNNSKIVQKLAAMCPEKLAIGTTEAYKISVLTPTEAKGLEFDSCFVIPENMTANEKYIALTRALSELLVVDG